MAANLARALRLVYGAETEWNRIVADPDAPRALRGTLGVVVCAATVAAAIGYLVLRPVGTSLAYVAVTALVFAAGRLGATLLAWTYLRSRKDIPSESATLIAGYGSMPLHLAGTLEILPIPFMRWLWVAAGLGFAYMTLAAAMTPVLGASPERGAGLTRLVTVLLALPVVALDLLRYACP